MEEGEVLTVDQALHGIDGWLRSAEWMGWPGGLAEAVSGSVSAFADLMNRTAADIGM